MIMMKGGNISANLENLKREFTQEANKMRDDRMQIERLRQDIKTKEMELDRLEKDFKSTEQQYHAHESEIRQATQDLQRIQKESAVAHSSIRPL